MAQTVKLPDNIMQDVRAEAALQSRSLASQVVHWINLGCEFENAPDTDMAKIRAALAGDLNPDLLTKEEGGIYFDAYMNKMSDPASIPGVSEAYTKLGKD